MCVERGGGKAKRDNRLAEWKEGSQAHTVPVLPAGTARRITRVKDLLKEDNNRKQSKSDHQGPCCYVVILARAEFSSSPWLYSHVTHKPDFAQS